LAGRAHNGPQSWPADEPDRRHIGALIGGFLVSSLLGFRYIEGFNLPSILVATLGAVILLAVFGGLQNRRVS